MTFDGGHLLNVYSPHDDSTRFTVREEATA